MDHRKLLYGVSLWGALAPATLAHAAWPPNGAPVCTISGDQTQVAILADGARGAIVVWRDLRGADADLFAQRVDSTGAPAWTLDGVPVCTGTGGSIDPVAIADGRGGTIVAWADDRAGHFDVFAQRIDAAGARAWTPGGIPVCAVAAHQSAPRIVSDGAAGAIVVWLDERSGARDIYAQRVDSTGTPRWAAGGTPVCAAAQDQSGAAIVAGVAGDAMVAWHDARAGQYHVFAQRLTRDGVAAWTPDGIAVCLARNGQYNPSLAPDGQGGAILGWTDYRAADGDIYAQRVDSAGMALWTTDGVPVCATSAVAFDPRLVSDGAGGAILAWQDFRGPATDFDVYAQRVDSAGAPRWTLDGVGVCTAERSKAFPAIAADGLGGAIVAWHDHRDGQADVFGQRIDALGTPLWFPNGVELGGAPGDQLFPAIVADGAGGAFLAWQDHRATPGSDVYAQRVLSTGHVPSAGVSAVPPGLTLSAPAPNPAHAGFAVRLTLTEARVVRAELLDLAGRSVATIAADARLERGTHTFAWDARAGARLAPGVYFLRVRAGPHAQARRIAITR